MRTRFSSRMVAPLLSAPLALALGCGHPAVEAARQRGPIADGRGRTG